MMMVENVMMMGAMRTGAMDMTFLLQTDPKSTQPL